MRVAPPGRPGRADGAHHRGCSVPSTTSLRPLAAALVLAGGCAEAPQGECQDDASFFREEVYPKVVQAKCVSCHNPTGLARDSDLVFVPTAQPDHLEANRAALASVATLEREGTSLVVRKPQGLDAHGGGVVYEEGATELELLRAFVDRLENPVVCDGPGDDRDDDAGLTLLSPAETFRKAALLLAGRLPTGEELAAIRSGGETALVPALWSLMEEERFVEVFVERLNDRLLTDKYLDGRTGIDLVDDEAFPGITWYRDAEDDDLARQKTADAIAREPLELAAHVLREDLPWSTVLTADHTMVNAWSAQAYGVPTDGYPDPFDAGADAFWPATIPGWPHAGLLTTPAWLNRYPTTATNRNRHRAWAFLKTFLATDILTFADRPIDPTISSAHNPTLNDPQCTVCHATMDPVAGLFQDWDEEGARNPRAEGWYAEMVSPGWGEEALPSSYRSDGLSFLAERATADPRFATAAVHLALEAVTGLEVLTPQLAGTDPALVEALDAQERFVADTAEEFTARGQDLKVVFERVILSRYFRAVAAEDASDGALVQAGTAHLLTPEELERKITATVGFPWRPRYEATPWLQDEYHVLYGGIDSSQIVDRLKDPNGVIAAIGLRMATEMACTAVPLDLVTARQQRRLLPKVEVSYEPTTDDGFAVPDAEAAIRANLVWLHERLLGETLAPDDPEIEASYTLWREIQASGEARVRSGELDDHLPDACRATRDPWTNTDLPSERRLDHDPTFTVRAWIAVVTHLLADWRFVNE